MRPGFSREEGSVPRAPAVPSEHVQNAFGGAERRHHANTKALSAGAPCGSAPPGITDSPRGPCPGVGEERCQLICVHVGASPGYVLPTRDFVGDALEESRLLARTEHRGAPSATAEPPTATHRDRGAQLAEAVFIIPEGSVTFT